MYVLRALVIALLSLCAVTTGCKRDDGPPLGRVTGRVTYQGKPIETGRILFEDKSQSVAMTAELQQDGQYVFQMAHGAGLPLGNYQVALQPPILMPGAGSAVPDKKTSFPDLPKKYLGTSSSEMNAAVKEGDNRFDFDLK